MFKKRLNSLFALLFLTAFNLAAQVTEDTAKLSNYSLGVKAYTEGEFRRAFDAWSLGAYEGNAEAQYNLGVLYLEGHGVERNIEQAREWFMRAAEKSHVEAQYNLGVELCCSGRDTKKAVAWLCRATKQNHFDAPYQMANIYTGSVREDGKMVKSFDSGYYDLSFSYMWYTVAMAQGHDAAARGRSKLEGRMTREQIMQGKRWATGWKKMSCPPL